LSIINLLFLPLYSSNYRVIVLQIHIFLARVLVISGPIGISARVAPPLPLDGLALLLYPAGSVPGERERKNDIKQ
jgi:hypothetical protein